MCKRLASVKLHEGIKSIGELAFSQCESLKSIALPHSLTEIGAEAFHSSGLKSITVPKAVVSIGERAFGVCESLASVKLFDTITHIGSDAFDAKSRLQINYSGSKTEFISIYPAFAPIVNIYGKVQNREMFGLVCERDPEVIRKRLWVGGNILALAAMIAAGVIVSINVPNGLHWSIAMFTSIVVNMLIAIITHYTDDSSEYWLQFVADIIELVACGILLCVSAGTTVVLVESVSIAVGLLISTIYIIISDTPDWVWKFIIFEVGALFIPLAILTWSLLGLAIPLLVLGIIAVISAGIWCIADA
jgi:hypothetical protein